MRTNPIGDLGVYSDGTTANPDGLDGVRSFGLDFAIYDEPADRPEPYGKGTLLLGRRCRHLVLDRSGQRPLLRRHDPVDGRPPSEGASNFRDESAKLVYEALKPATPLPTAAPANLRRRAAH